jgi:hypothetical protein
VTSPRTVSTWSTPSRVSAAGSLSGDLARALIWCPALAGAATACEPRYPVPPVTTRASLLHLQVHLLAFISGPGSAGR